MRPFHARHDAGANPSRNAGRTCPTRPGRWRRRYLAVEALEDRQMLSVAPVSLPLDTVAPSNTMATSGIEPGVDGDGVADIVIDLTSGNITIDQEALSINGYIINSQAGIFTGEPANNLGELAIDNHEEISASFISWEGRFHDLGDVIAPAEFAGVDLFADLTFVYTLEDTQGIFDGTLRLAGDASVAGRHVFYNNSTWDGGDAGANAQDDDAIAVDKQALLPGATATFANYTSYSRGINGIMVDVAGLADGGALGADDFRFAVGNSDDPTGWAEVVAQPSISVRTGEGLDGSDRVTVIWPDNAIEKQWLEVTVLATVNTALAEDDVFYFGNAIGETGNSTGDAMVTSGDEIGARSNPHIFDPAPIDDAFDFDRDKLVSAVDQIVARGNITIFDALNLISPPAGDASPQAAGLEPASAEACLDNLDWLMGVGPDPVHDGDSGAVANGLAIEGLLDLYGK